MESQKAGFVAQGHRITRRLERLLGLDLACGHTLKQVAWKYNVHPSIVKDIDRRRLERRFKDRRPHRCRYLAVDEFLLHRGHRYEYCGAAEPPVRCGESHLSGLTEPPQLALRCYLACAGSNP